MKERSKLTLSGLIITIVVIAFWLLIIFPVLEKVKRIATKTVCTVNLKGLGTASTVYANDYNDAYPQLPGTGPWSKRLGFDYFNTTPDFDEGGAEHKVSRTITASLYLLVREADVSPKAFICPHSNQGEFDPSDYGILKDVIELWDFGPDPYKHVSYAYHNPYGQFPANLNRTAAFAVLADMNPWFKYGDVVQPGLQNRPPQLLTISDAITKEQFKNSNAYHHGYEGQNVTYADGHAGFEKSSNVGVKYDNIYTYWSSEENPSEQDTQGGTAPTGRSPENDAKSKDDSFLVL